MSANLLSAWTKCQTINKADDQDSPIFYRNLEEALDVRRKSHSLFNIKTSPWKEGLAVDFSSNDTLSLGASGLLRAGFTRERVLFPKLLLCRHWCGSRFPTAGGRQVSIQLLLLINEQTRSDTATMDTARQI